MSRVCTTALILALLAAHGVRALHAQVPGNMGMFEPRPLTVAADPEQRHHETFKVPLRIQIESRDGRICVQEASSSLVEIPISVGKLMTVGLESTLFYYADAERKNMTGAHIGTSYMGGTLCRPLPEVVDLAAVQGFVQFVEEITLFETDLPSQHMWRPKAGRYRVLWRGVAIGTYRP